MLRFADGSFRPFARLQPTNYVKKGLRKRKRIIEQTFAEAFGELG